MYDSPPVFPSPRALATCIRLVHEIKDLAGRGAIPRIHARASVANRASHCFDSSVVVTFLQLPVLSMSWIRPLGFRPLCLVDEIKYLAGRGAILCDCAWTFFGALPAGTSPRGVRHFPGVRTATWVAVFIDGECTLPRGQCGKNPTKRSETGIEPGSRDPESDAAVASCSYYILDISTHPITQPWQISTIPPVSIF